MKRPRRRHRPNPCGNDCHYAYWNGKTDSPVVCQHCGWVLTAEGWAPPAKSKRRKK